MALAIWSEVRAGVRTESAQLDNSGGTDVAKSLELLRGILA